MKDFSSTSELSQLNTDMRDFLERFIVDRDTLDRALPPPLSPRSSIRLRQFFGDWQEVLETVNFDALDVESRVDYLLFANHLAYERRLLDIQDRRQGEMAALLPFAPALIQLEEARQRMEPVDAARSANALDDAERQITKRRHALETGSVIAKDTANRAAEAADALRATLATWFTFYDRYDPVFSWWAREPYKTVCLALEEYAKFLRETLVGVKAEDSAPIVGNPIGREALLSELAHELIPYTPEELIAIGDREYAWCEAEMRRASRELGCGDDWRQAVELVKTRHVAPGEQADLVRDLAYEAIAFVDAHDLVTVPDLAREVWRREMMSPEHQKVNPFFLGGETILISFPTDGMTHEQKQMSLRGNNRHFARATVQHELIPGHHLQLFMADRYRTYRRVFHTPFYVEGWALHWEMLLWDMGFARSPEDRIGMLFWRMHRCARIGFSLRFHLGQITPQECIDLLVERVGHERANAIAEVRRSFGKDYPPLYQCAYMIGGLQMRRLYQELVTEGTMTPRAFHDAVLKHNAIPIEMLRACLTDQPLARDFTSNWRFDE